MSKRSAESEAGDSGRRDTRKQRTRRALMDAALELMQGDKSFNSISLREVARNAGVVPTAFYRHFRDMDELGLALVDEALMTLRQTMREARAMARPTGDVIKRSLTSYLGYVQEHKPQFQFLAKERFGGSRAMRLAIRHGVQLFVSELSTDLARFPFLQKLSTEELQMIATLVVNIVINLAEQLLDLSPDDLGAQRRLEKQAYKQVLLVFLGVGQWRPESERR